jgi:hypothetical protein
VPKAGAGNKPLIESDDANGNAPFYAVDDWLFQEDRQSYCDGRHSCRVLQFRQNPQDAEDHPAMAAGLSEHVWSLEEIVQMADSYMSKPSKRGPYKKRTEENRG